MAKKMNMTVARIIAEQVNKRVIKIKEEKAKKIAQNDPEFKKLDKLSKQLEKINKEYDDIKNSLCKKHNWGYILLRHDEHIINVSHDSYYETKQIAENLMLESFSSNENIDIEGLINKLVEKYSK